MGFVEVPADALRAMLAKAGFRLCEPEGNFRGQEEVYSRAHDKDPRYVVKMYSTILRDGSGVRGSGEDAIRVVVVKQRANGSWVGIYKAKRVHRTGSVDAVLERTLDRMREAYRFINHDIGQNRRSA